MIINNDMLNNVFSKAKVVNDDLRNKSEENNRDSKALITDALDFHITSMAMSHIVYKYYEDGSIEDEYSLGQVLLLRSLIESFALKRYAEDKKDELLKEVFKYQVYIFEYEVYSKFKMLDKKMFDLDQMNINRKKAREHIVSNKKDHQFKISEVFNNRVPFINDDLSYNEIINDYLGEEYLTTYQQLSLFIHPHDYNIDYKFKDEIISFSNNMVLLIDKEYELKESIKEDLHFFDNSLIANHPHALSFINDINEQVILIDDISRLFAENNRLGVSAFIYKFKGIIKEIAYDMIFGLSEVITMKLKSIIELLAIFDYMLFNDDYESLFNKIMIHTSYQSNKNTNKLTDELEKEMFDSYNKELIKEVSFEEFKDKMSKTLGFIEVKLSITSFAVNFAKDYNFFKQPYIGLNGKEYKVNNNIYLHLKYLESQRMSHANGYLYFVNSGAWTDGVNFIIIIDKYIYKILSKYRKRSGTMYKDITSFLKEFKKLKNEKLKFFAIANVFKQYI